MTHNLSHVINVKQNVQIKVAFKLGAKTLFSVPSDTASKIITFRMEFH